MKRSPDLLAAFIGWGPPIKGQGREGEMGREGRGREKGRKEREEKEGEGEGIDRNEKFLFQALTRVYCF